MLGLRSAASRGPGTLATGLARRLGLRAGDVGRHLAHELLKVVQAPQPVSNWPGFLPEDGSVVGDAPEQPQDAIFVYHVLTAPPCDTGRELPVRAGDARELVEVDLPGGCLPPNPANGIIIEEEAAACGHSSGQLERRMVEHQEVHARRHQDVEGVRRLAAEVRRDVDVRIGAVLPRGATAMQIREQCPSVPEHSSGLRHHRCRPGFIHLPSLADHWFFEPNHRAL